MKHPPLNEEGRRLLERAAQFVPGLLASGHFTNVDPDDSDTPYVNWSKNGNGEDWREDQLDIGSSYVVDSAIALAKELEGACWMETASDAEREAFFEARMKDWESRGILKQKVA